MGNEQAIAMGRRIRLARDRMRFSQSEVARRVGLSKQAVQNWERGEAMPKQSRIVEVAKLLDCDERWLLTGEGMDEWEDEELGRLLTHSQRQLLEQYESLSSDNKLLLQELADTLKRAQNGTTRQRRTAGETHQRPSGPRRLRPINREDDDAD